MQQNLTAAKVALITGAARRIGAEIARTLHEAGMNVIVHYNTSEAAAIDLCQQLNEKRQGSACVVHANLAEPDNENILIKRALLCWGRLDVLVNNASRFYRTPMGEVTALAWDDLINSNLKAPFFLSQAAAPFLREGRGSIVNIADIHGKRPLRDYSAYCISKAAVVMMTKVLAKELGPLVRVNGVAPGSILWPEAQNELSADQKQKIIDRTVLLKAGAPEEIAKAVLFLVRDANYITGHIINVDGGRLL